MLICLKGMVMFSSKSIHTFRQVRLVDLSTSHSLPQHYVSINQCHRKMGEKLHHHCAAKKRLSLVCFGRILFILIYPRLSVQFFKSETALFCNEVHPRVDHNDTLAYIKWSQICITQHFETFSFILCCVCIRYTISLNSILSSTPQIQ